MTKILFTLFCAITLAFNCFAYRPDYDVRTPSDITVERLNVRFKGTRLEGKGKWFIMAQEKYGINAVFLAAIAMHESANGKSRLARTKNNFFGLRGKNGMLSFKTPEDCIMYTARLLTKKKGVYFGKGNYTIRRIGKKYASSKHWTTRVIKHMKQIS